MFSYEAPNVYRASVVTGIYEGSYGNQESFAKAKPPAAPAKPAESAQAAGLPGWAAPVAAATAVVAVGGVWLRRRSASRDGD
jgi:hypothetical protein